MILPHIVDFSIRRRGLILFFTMLLIILGVWSAFRVPLDAIPDITPTQVQVNTQISGLVPEDIEKLVTIPLEQELGGIPGLRESRSLSKYGLSQITLIFDEGADILRARQMVSERLQNRLGELPEGAQPRLAPITSGLGEIYYYVVDYKKGSKPSKQSRENQLMELKLLHDLRIKPLLRTVPGVAEVNDSGGYERQVIIAPDINKMTQAGITFSELARVISENTANSGGGIIQLGGEQIGVMGAFRVENLQEIESIPIRFAAGARPLTVGDLASVRIGSSIRTGTATYNGRESVLGSVLMLTGANSRVVAKEVGERLQVISKQLPSEVEIIPVYDRTDLIRKTIKTVGFNLFEGAMLVIAVLLLMLGDWRAALIVASAIPLSFLFAITGMAESKISANLLSLGAIDFGLIIDGAVVMVENIIRHVSDKQAELGRTLTPEERRREVSISANEVARPTFIGVLIVTVVYIPILALTGIEGRMFKPMALTVMFALGGAPVLSLTLMPALCSLYLVGNIREKESRLVGAVRRFYEPLLDRAFKRRGWLVAASVLLFALSAWLFTRLGAEFIPRLDEGSYATHLIRTTSIGLDASLEMQKQSEEVILKEFPEVTYTFSRIGTSEIATDPMGVNVSDTYIFYKPKSEWPERESYKKLQPKEALASEMTRVLQQRVPGQSYLFSQPIEMRFNEILEGTRADISVKVFGDDYAELERLAGETRNILSEVRGVASVEFDSLGTAPLLSILPRRDELLRFNVHGRELNDAIHSGLAGMEAGDLIQGSRRPHTGPTP
jgi:heavy metal efflux system protein